MRLFSGSRADENTHVFGTSAPAYGVQFAVMPFAALLSPPPRRVLPAPTGRPSSRSTKQRRSSDRGLDPRELNLDGGSRG